MLNQNDYIALRTKIEVNSSQLFLNLQEKHYMELFVSLEEHRKNKLNKSEKLNAFRNVLSCSDNAARR